MIPITKLSTKRTNLIWMEHLRTKNVNETEQNEITTSDQSDINTSKTSQSSKDNERKKKYR